MQQFLMEVLDFIFKNNYNIPVYIKITIVMVVVTCQIYGNSKDKQNIEIFNQYR